jgi:hypothetical protein
VNSDLWDQSFSHLLRQRWRAESRQRRRRALIWFVVGIIAALATMILQGLTLFRVIEGPATYLPVLTLLLFITCSHVSLARLHGRSPWELRTRIPTCKSASEE